MRKINYEREELLHHKREKERLHKIRNSRLLSSVEDTTFLEPSAYNGWEKKIVVPEKFTLYNNPNSVIDVALELDNIDKESHIDSIFYDFSKCEDMDLAASTIIDVFSVKKITEINKHKNQKINVNGKNSKSKNVNIMMNANGIKKHLGFVHHKYGENNPDFSFIDLLIGGKKTNYIKVNNSLNSSVASTRIVSFYDNCLRKHGYSLSAEGERTIFGLSGEVIDNCEQHANPNNDPKYGNQWFVNAFHRRIDNEISSISIVIMNFGLSIYEGINEVLNQPNIDLVQIEMKNRLVELSEKNKTWLTNKLTDETLYTLYALQEGVSRKRTIHDLSRGMGTISLIETFQKLGESLRKNYETRMCLLSGSAFIKFDKKYKIGTNPETKRKNIAFNKENDLTVQPDKKNVYSLKKAFPGTIISMDFYFDSKYIEKMKKGER